MERRTTCQAGFGIERGLTVAAITVVALVVGAGCAAGSSGSQSPGAAGSESAGAVAPTTPPVLAHVATSIPSPTPFVVPPTPTPLSIEEHTLLFSGDVLSHTPVIAAALNYGDGADWPYDYRPMFAGVRDRVRAADLALCVLETPVSVDNTGLTGYPTFNAPRELPDALVHAGYDGCSTASNHSMDRGPTGVGTTLDQMDRAGLAHAGMARSATEAATATRYELDGVSIAHLSWTYGLNGFVLPDDEPWLVNVTDVARVRAEAEQAHADGADLVVLSIQWGNEYQRQPSPEQLDLAKLLTAGGASGGGGRGVDLIIGNHAHVVQPVAWVNDVPVVYGLGNSLSNQYDNQSRTGTQDGVMVEATVAGNTDIGWRVIELAYAPTWVDRSSYTIVDLIAVLAERDGADPLRSTWQESFDRTAEAIALLGGEIALAVNPD